MQLATIRRIAWTLPFWMGGLAFLLDLAFTQPTGRDRSPQLLRMESMETLTGQDFESAFATGLLWAAIGTWIAIGVHYTAGYLSSSPSSASSAVTPAAPSPPEPFGNTEQLPPSSTR